ncbi:MAG: hypothetical protein KA173_02195, partial [Rhodoferax sp.]|nr:hypothetical protein [Rhodoferax sp.]
IDKKIDLFNLPSNLCPVQSQALKFGDWLWFGLVRSEPALLLEQDQDSTTFKGENEQKVVTAIVTLGARSPCNSVRCPWGSLGSSLRLGLSDRRLLRELASRLVASGLRLSIKKTRSPYRICAASY